MKALRISIVAAFLAPAAFAADATDAEIAYLINAIGDSGCTFIRNGKEHDAENAEEHIRLKFRRGKRYATSTEAFIDRLASKSSMSKKPYFIDCAGDGPVPTGEGLRGLLAELRKNDSVASR